MDLLLYLCAGRGGRQREMKIDRIMIAAPKSGSGKTLITCALLQALKEQGQQVFAYKCGPDYIDPMFHQKVIGVPSKNLDTFFTGEEGTRRLFLRDRKEGDFAVLEGVMGLFDGLGGVKEEGSSYHLAQVTKTPIILVVDAKGMGRSLVPLLSGFQQYDRGHFIQGVILNRISKSYYEILKPILEAELQADILGYFGEHKELAFENRHLGLKMPGEVADFQKKILLAAEELKKTVSLEKILQIAAGAEELPGRAEEFIGGGKSQSSLEGGNVPKAGNTPETARPVIAVARDEAFCFYYEDNLRLLEECGAKIKYFSPLHDKRLPKGCCGILIGGGYPELFAERLGSNTKMAGALREAVQDKMPIVAECGGFLYLQTALLDAEGRRYAMAGVLPSSGYDTGKAVRFGYVELEEKESSFLPAGERIKGHEFHYFDSTDNGSDCLAIKPVTGRQYPCVMTGEDHWLGFPHLYYPSNPAFAKRFVEKACRYRDRKGGTHA